MKFYILYSFIGILVLNAIVLGYSFFSGKLKDSEYLLTLNIMSLMFLLFILIRYFLLENRFGPQDGKLLAWFLILDIVQFVLFISSTVIFGVECGSISLKTDSIAININIFFTAGVVLMYSLFVVLEWLRMVLD